MSRVEYSHPLWDALAAREEAQKYLETVAEPELADKVRKVIIEATGKTPISVSFGFHDGNRLHYVGVLFADVLDETLHDLLAPFGEMMVAVFGADASLNFGEAPEV